MSNFANLPKKIAQSLINLEKRIVTFPIEDKINRYKRQYKDFKHNRELIVVDKYGNRYYQYYSHQGLPTKRVVENNFKSFMNWDDDPVMLGWLQKRRDIPPSQEELEKIYIQNEEFQRRGLEWDNKDKLLIDGWKNKQKEKLEAEREENKSLGEGADFTPGKWDKGNQIVTQEENQLVEVKEEKELMEGASTLPGKYIMEYNQEDREWMKRQEEKYLAPLNEMIKKIDFSVFTFEAMAAKAWDPMNEGNNKIKEKQQELTNTGRKMLEKKEQYKSYNGFREQFKDVFEEYDFVIKV